MACKEGDDGWTRVSHKRKTVPDVPLTIFTVLAVMIAKFTDKFQKKCLKDGEDDALYFTANECEKIVQQISDLIREKINNTDVKIELVIKKFFLQYEDFVREVGQDLNEDYVLFKKCLKYCEDFFSYGSGENEINCDDPDAATEAYDESRSRGLYNRSNVVRDILTRKSLEKKNERLGTNYRPNKSLKNNHKPRVPRPRNTKETRIEHKEMRLEHHNATKNL